jgi:hypothetical protein
MSCDVAAAAFLFFASTSPGMPAPSLALAAIAAPPSVASEPLFRDIVGRAGHLKQEVEGYRKSLAGASAPVPLTGYAAFQSEIGQLADLDEQGHKTLVARGSADDLKCILHGISQDLPQKLGAMAAAKTGHDQDQALRDMAYLLNDNVEVITSPPQPAA